MEAKKYAENLEAYAALDEISFGESTPKDEVIQGLIDNSNAKRKIAVENNQILEEYLYKYVKNPELMNDEAAEKIDELLNVIGTDFNMSMDTSVAYDGCEALYKYHAGRKDYEKTIKYMYLAAGLLMRLDQHLDIAPENPYYTLAMELLPVYDSLSDEGKDNFRKLFLISGQSRGSMNIREKKETYFHFLESHNITKETPGVAAFLGNIICMGTDLITQNKRMELFHKEKYRFDFTVKDIEEDVELYRKLEHLLPPINKLNQCLFWPQTEYQTGKITLEEACEKLKNLKLDTDGLPEIYRLAYSIPPHSHYLRFIQAYQAYPPEEIQRICRETVQRVMAELKPYLHQNTNFILNYQFLTLISTASEIIGLEEYLPLLEKLTIMSSKSLFIHTKMVAELSLAIFDSVYDKKPEYFTGVDGYDEDYVRTHGKELRDLLSKSAMLHDFGKFFISDIIANSSRKLTDYEFFMIQNHPLNITNIYEAPPTRNEKVIIDVSRLHHLWYDETKGYPLGYHHTENKPFVNIVSIADSIDAATDYIGRPYARIKNVDEIVSEISSMKGTRYEAFAAECITEPELKEKIRYIIEERRSEINYEVYTDKASSENQE